MRVVLAPDGFGGLLTPPAAAAAMAAGWRSAAPDDEVATRPLSDGGPGFVATLHASLGGRLAPVTVRGPLGEPTPAAVLVVGSTAYVEAAQASGAGLLPDGRWDGLRASSVGVGDLLAHARATGARRVVVGLGGPAATDAGLGMLAGLGLGGGTGALAGGGGRLAGLVDDDLAGLAALRAGWDGIELVAAVDTDAPLLGLRGAAAGFTAQAGAAATDAQRLEGALAHASRLAVAALGGAERPDLLTGRPAGERLAGTPGSGAAGGLGFGLTLLGARLARGASLVADAVGLDEALGAGELAVTGVGRLDWRSLDGSVVAEVAQRALAHGVPTVAVAGQVLVGRREQAAAGISGAYDLVTGPSGGGVVADPAEALAVRTAAVARTWSPRRR